MFKLIYEFLFSLKQNDETLSALLTKDFNSLDKDYICACYDGITEKYAELTALTEKFSPKYTCDKMFKADLAAIIVSVYELLYLKDQIPPSVSINEAVELSKKYSHEDGYKFVNGVLSSLSKGIK